MQHINKEKRKTNIKYFIIYSKVLKIMSINNTYKSLRFWSSFFVICYEIMFSNKGKYVVGFIVTHFEWGLSIKSTRGFVLKNNIELN